MDRFADLVVEFADRPGVVVPDGGRGFGASALKAGRSIFAMEVDGSLVVKLPATRVVELIANGTGGPYDAGKGRPMKEWLRVVDDDRWNDLAEEALAFVSSR